MHLNISATNCSFLTHPSQLPTTGTHIGLSSSARGCAAVPWLAVEIFQNRSEMNACKDTCRIMLEVQTAVISLELSSGKLLVTKPQLSRLQSLDTELQAASMKINNQRFTTPHQEEDLLQSFASLTSALVPQLDVLELTAATSTGSNSLAGKALQHLWCLLFTTCQIFHTCLVPWPVKSQQLYAPVRKAIHSLMTFFLRITRGRSSVWFRSVEGARSSFRIPCAHTICTVPLAYVLSLATWPTQHLVNELEVLPADFISLLCCLTLENLESTRDAIPVSVQEQGIPMMSLQHSKTLSIPILSLCASLNELLSRATTVDPSMDTLERFACPAVIQLCKRTLVILASYQGRRLVEAGEKQTVTTLMMLQQCVHKINAHASQFPTMDEFLQSCSDNSSVALLPVYKPAVHVSEVHVLRLLFESTLCEAEFMQMMTRYCLITDIIQDWTEGTSAYTPFPSPDFQEQGKCIYLALHHCCGSLLVHMKEQRQQLQPAYQSGIARIACAASPGNPAITSTLQLLTSIVLSHTSKHARPATAAMHAQSECTFLLMWRCHLFIVILAT